MAALVLRCRNCGKEFVAQRRHARCCSELCKKRFQRRLRSDSACLPGVPDDFERCAWESADRDGLEALTAALLVLCRLDLEAAA